MYINSLYTSLCPLLNLSQIKIDRILSLEALTYLKVLIGAIDGAQAPMIDRQTYKRKEVMRLERINDFRMKWTTTTLV